MNNSRAGYKILHRPMGNTHSPQNGSFYLCHYLEGICRIAKTKIFPLLPWQSFNGAQRSNTQLMADGVDIQLSLKINSLSFAFCLLILIFFLLFFSIFQKWNLHIYFSLPVPFLYDVFCKFENLASWNIWYNSFMSG